MFTIESGSEAAIHMLKALDFSQGNADPVNIQVALQPQTQQILIKVNARLVDGSWSKPLNLNRA